MVLILDSSIFVICLLDFGVSLNTIRITRKGIHVTNRRDIFIRYLKSYMIPDLITLFPSFAFNDNLYYLFRYLKILKLSYLSKFITLQNIQLIWYWFKKIDKKPYKTFKMRINEKFVEIISVSFSIFVVIHTASCIFIFLGEMNSESVNWIDVFCTNCSS